ncbi:MAG: HAMP domain-containing sensor histidine kinase [bacterium]|nr:HAMP domain-containing sensor histidine kinase [bacterium]
MEKDKRNHEAKKTLEPKIGEPGYLNKNCWLVKNLKSNSYKRCQYCESRFKNCLFLQYQAISAFLIVFFIILSFFIKGKIPEIELILLIVFSFVIIYGYFFNKSTNKLTQAYFVQRRAKEALEKLAEELESRVKQRTKELEAANQKLIEMDKLKTGMFSFVSHQIKAPIAIVKGFAQLLREDSYGKIPEKAKETVGHIKESCDRLIDLVNDFLDLRKIEEGKIEYQFADINIVDLVRGIADDLRLLAQNKGLELTFEEPKTVKIMVKVDEQRLRQIIQNLIDNSIKYTEQGWVRVTIDYDHDNDHDQRQESVLIKVEDSGIGISKESLPTLFDQFIRTKETRAIKGTGLGLYIAKQIVEAHQGEVWAESEGEGKGSRFYVRLMAMNKN